MSNVTLSRNGSPAPSTYQVGSQTVLSVLVDGSAPLSVEWSYGLRAGPKITGVGDIQFSPVVTEPYYLHAVAVKADGTSAEAIFILSVTATGASAAAVSIVWSDPAPKAAGPNSASISISGVVPPRSIAWTHYANGAMFSSGKGASVALGHLQPGIHRVFATVIDSAGNTVIGDSSIHVPAEFGLQAAVVPPQPVNSSLVYLGAVYTQVIEGDAALATSLPFLLTTLNQSVKLIPGTTHFQAVLDPEMDQVDDEVVVRTQLGNWTLKGPPTGLTAETLPYDYQHGQPFQPAPLDLGVRYTVEAWNVHGVNVSRFKFRVQFKCFSAGEAVYRYTPCEWSSYSGGLGERQRRLMAVVSKVDLVLDDETPQNRGLSMAQQTFTAPNQGYIIGNFEASGKPDRPMFAEDHFYTPQNVAAVYEKEDSPEIQARVTYGMPSVRPCVTDFSYIGLPRMVNKPKRLWGKLMLYVAGGAFNAGTVVTVAIRTGKQPGYAYVPVTVGQDVYNPAYDGFVKAGEADIDITDFEFSRLGLVMDFTIDESSAGTMAPSVDPMMTVGEDFYYTRVNSPAIRIDTACFKNPVLQTTFEGTFLGSAVPLTSCNTTVCGPLGTYCYVEVSGTGTYKVLQPLGYPAPFVAPYGDEAHCYKNPVFFGEYDGGVTTAQHRAVGYTGTTGCGSAYQYNPCSAAVQQQLAVVFPLATVPHSAISYNAHCYTLVGAVKDLSLLTTATSADVTPVTGCTDVICTGSDPNGGSLDYIDEETLQQVTVAFPHMAEQGVPLFAVTGESVSQGYGATAPGEIHWELWKRPTFQVMRAVENATLTFEITPADIQRELVVTRAGVRSHYRFQPGLHRANIPLTTGDVVTLEFGLNLNRYKGKSGTVKWHKEVTIPYLYDQVTFNLPAATGTLTALGFCGLSNRQDYCFYGTLGTKVEMDLPNPDSLVTVKDTGTLVPELILVRTKQPHEAEYHTDLQYYKGQKLTSPVTLKFYAGRTRAGGHGELDVWTNVQGSTFPQYLKVSDFKSLVLADYAYRKTTVQTDTSRRALRVIPYAQSGRTSPRIHVDDRGRNLSVVTDTLNDYVYENGLPYSFTGSYDYGISETIYRDLVPGGGPELKQLMSMPSKPRGLCYVPTLDEVWVACDVGNQVVILNGDGSVVKQYLSVTGRPHSCAYCTDSGCVAVACMDTGSVKLIHASTRIQTNELFIPEGPFYTFIAMFASYNPVSQNVYVAGVPNSNFDLGVYEINPSTAAVRSFQFGIGAVSLAGNFYCATTKETYIATEGNGGWAFNVSTTVAEPLGVPTSTCRGACDVPEYGRVLFSNAANPPGGRLFTYDPRSRQVIFSTSYSNPVRATGWHPLRRKYYLSTLSIYAGGPGVGIVNTNGVRLAVVDDYDWGYQWVYSPIARRMFCTVPATFYGSNYLAVYS